MTQVLQQMESADGTGTRCQVQVDGRAVEVTEGLTILQALLQEGLDIPHLCHDIRLQRSNGNCGLCVVEVSLPGEPEASPITTDLDSDAVPPRAVKACHTPIRAGMTITTASSDLHAYRTLRLEQILADHNADCVAPCQEACPARIDIQGYLGHVVDGNDQAALRVIKDRNPFPSVCGRVCPHPCELACRRNLVDEPVAINPVKRYVADVDMAGEPWIPRVAPPTGRRVAVVGAGPSGLSCASYLALAGHEVTVFERQEAPGGMMRYGIPEYRLPKRLLDREIATITALGVQIVTGKTLGTHLALADLRRDFDAVYLAIGSWHATPLAIDGDTLRGVWLGIHYLEEVVKAQVTDAGSAGPAVGRDVVVIGGGNTAIDCARTALRAGAHVTLLYRRSRDEMPAEPQEVAAALEEGVEMVFLTSPTRITRDDEGDGRLRVHCLRMELGAPDRSGRRRPVPVDDSAHTVVADTVIGAIGQSTNTQFLYHDLPVTLNRWGDIQADAATLQTSQAKIFAGGDCVTGPATVIQAVGAGRLAAKGIHQFLTRGYARPSHRNYRCSRGTLEDLPRHEFEAIPRIARHPMPEAPLKGRTEDFRQVELGLDADAARAEAARCLHCGCAERFDCQLRRQARQHGIAYRPPLHERPWTPIVRDHPYIVRDTNKCFHCGRCIAACAELEGPGVLAFQFAHGRLTVGTHSGAPLRDTDCVSCGQCVNSCPCGALDFVRERGDVFRALHDPTMTVVGFVAPAPRSVISQEFGIPFEEASPFIAGLLRQLGFDKVFDFSFAADLTVLEETTEFLRRITGAETGSPSNGPLPQFTSCCPGWVNWVERRHPGLIPHLSSCKSPQQMMGATVTHHFAREAGIPRDRLFVVSIVPCLAKKDEAARPQHAPEGVRDVDAVLTTDELLEMVKMVRLETDDIVPSEFDDPYRRVSGAGVLFGASGGVAEAALRMAVAELTGTSLLEEEARHLTGPLEFAPTALPGVREVRVVVGDRELRVAVVSGLDHAEPLIAGVLAGEDIGYDLVEVMACPGGCIAGAGNPMVRRTDELARRQRVLTDIDRTSRYRASQDNPDIRRLYAEYYGEPNSPLARQLLHTTYAPFRPAP